MVPVPKASLTRMPMRTYAAVAGSSVGTVDAAARFDAGL